MSLSLKSNLNPSAPSGSERRVCTNTVSLIDGWLAVDVGLAAG